MTQVAEFVLYGALMVVGLLLYFVVIGHIISWPEKAIRWFIGRFRRKPPAPPPPLHHDGFDNPV